MKITNEESYAVFDHQVTIELDDDDKIKKINKWICQNFSSHFVLSEYSWKIISGGCADNSKSYKIRKDDAISGPVITHYELNCYDDDFVLFKLTWC